MAKDPTQIVNDYVAGVGNNGGKWARNIQASDSNPGQLAAAAGDKWQRACGTAQALENFKAVGKVPPSYWKSQSAASQSAYTGSTAKSKAKLQKMAPILAQMGAQAKQAAQQAPDQSPDGRIHAARDVSVSFSAQLRAARY